MKILPLLICLFPFCLKADEQLICNQSFSYLAAAGFPLTLPEPVYTVELGKRYYIDQRKMFDFALGAVFVKKDPELGFFKAAFLYGFSDARNAMNFGFGLDGYLGTTTNPFSRVSHKSFFWWFTPVVVLGKNLNHGFIELRAPLLHLLMVPQSLELRFGITF